MHIQLGHLMYYSMRYFMEFNLLSDREPETQALFMYSS